MSEPAQTQPAQAPEAPPRRRRGFAAMDPDRRRAICSAGGRAAHAQGRAHRFTPEEAVAAGRKGGAARARNAAARRHPLFAAEIAPESAAIAPDV